jgi:hypothetical protein
MPLSTPEIVTISAFENKAETADVSKVNQTITPTLFLTANSNRYLVAVYNDSEEPLYLKCGDNASINSWTVKIPTEGYYETPSRYTGPISGVWATPGSGAAYLTEFSDEG